MSNKESMDDDYVSLSFETNKHETFVNARNAGLVPLLSFSSEKAQRQFLPLLTCRPAVSAWGRGMKLAVLHVGSVDNTKRTTNGRRGEVNLVDTCLQHHLGSLWQNTY